MSEFPLFTKRMRHRSLLLLVTLLGLILLSGIQTSPSIPWVSGLLWSFYLFVFCLGGFLLASNQAWLRVFAGLCLPVILFGILIEVYPDSIPIGLVSRWLILVLQALMLATVIRFSLQHETHNQMDRLIAGICGYLILGLLWANIYYLCDLSGLGHFLTSSGEKATEQDGSLLYFSLVTMSSLGYGDITASTGFTRILSALEAICGTLYLGIFIAALVPRRDPPS